MPGHAKAREGRGAMLPPPLPNAKPQFTGIRRPGEPPSGYREGPARPLGAVCRFSHWAVYHAGQREMGPVRPIRQGEPTCPLPTRPGALS
jgi:hypothetical protein